MSRVLVVDDEVEICLLVTQYFKKLGYETSFCLSIAEAAEKLAVAALRPALCGSELKGRLRL